MGLVTRKSFTVTASQNEISRRTEGLLLAAGLAAVVAWMAAGLK